MAGTLGQVSFFVALILVIVVHEAAHFGAARWFGIKVEEFFVGFGPRIWSFRRGGTEYGLKAILAGGYVKISGMNPYQEVAPEDLPRTFGAKPIWQRAVVIVAGPATHFLIAFMCFAVWLGLVGEPEVRSPLIAEVVPTLEGEPSPAAVAGLREGDRVVAVGDIQDPTDLELVGYTRDHVGEPITLTVERDGGTFVVTVTPILSEVDGEKVGRIGVLLGEARETAGPVGVLAGGGRLVWQSIERTVESVGRVFGPEGIGRVVTLLFTDEEREPGRDPVSIVGIGRVAGQAAEGSEPGDLLYLFAAVNVFIGLLNLLPLPPFDGGHLAVLAMERIRGRKVDMRRIVPVSIAVAAFFIVFTLSVVYLDIVKPLDLRP